MDMSESARTGPKDVFGHLLATIGLYVCVTSFGALIFGLIEIYFPDVLNFPFGVSAKESLRWPLAVLVIVFPLYLWLVSYLQKDLEMNPEKRALKTRKWLLHFTLFAAAIVIVGDLIALIFRFLNGDLTIQFVLKVITVLLIALAVFVYYLWIIRRDIPAMKDPKMRLFVRSVVAVAVFFIVFGFINAGSPFSQRIRRFDERRVQNLQTIQSEIINYWQTKEVLPQTIDQLRDDIRGFVPPKDPETGNSYEYITFGALQFKLCAVFGASNIELPPRDKSIILPSRPEFVNEIWVHEAGRVCFNRFIDPDRYPPFVQPRTKI